jgi:hypothetical protein
MTVMIWLTVQTRTVMNIPHVIVIACQMDQDAALTPNAVLRIAEESVDNNCNYFQD